MSNKLLAGVSFLAIKDCLLVKDDVSSRDDLPLMWYPYPKDISRVISYQIPNMCPWVKLEQPALPLLSAHMLPANCGGYRVLVAFAMRQDTVWRPVEG